MSSEVLDEKGTPTMQTIRLEDLEKTLFNMSDEFENTFYIADYSDCSDDDSASTVARSIIMNEKYPPLPSSPAPSLLDDMSAMLYCTPNFTDETQWMFNIFDLYTSSGDMRIANNLRQAFEMGEYKPVSVSSLLNRIKLMTTGRKFTEYVEEWYIKHLEVFLKSGFVTF